MFFIHGDIGGMGMIFLYGVDEVLPHITRRMLFPFGKKDNILII